MPEPELTGPDYVPVAKNRWNARRTVHVGPLNLPQSGPLVVLTVYNNIDRPGYQFAMTYEEAQILASVLQSVPWTPPTTGETP